MSSKALCLLLGAFTLSGCASIIEGRSQELLVNTNPSGATCVLERSGAPIGTVSPTPSSILIQKTKYDIIIKCNLDGYQEATYFNKSGAAGATFGNIVLGGGIGWAIDSASGSDNKYDSPVNLTLVPVQPVTANIAPTKKESKPVAAPTTSKPDQPATTTPTPETKAKPKEESGYPMGNGG